MKAHRNDMPEHFPTTYIVGMARHCSNMFVTDCKKVGSEEMKRNNTTVRERDFDIAKLATNWECRE